MMSTYLKHCIVDALALAYRTTTGEEPPPEYLSIRATDRPEFGDYSSNIALLDGAARGSVPRKIAEELLAALQAQGHVSLFEKVQVAGPGFLNFFLHPETLGTSLREILSADRRFGRTEVGTGQTIQVEFVSSNPTGPLTVGHGRQAVLGDVLASLFERIGYRVVREYYFNDEGRQIDLLAESLWVRFRELDGDVHEIPEGGYQGEYLKGVAETLRAETEETFPALDEETRKWFRQEAVARMTAWIKQDLSALGVSFDEWFSERTLHEKGEIDAALAALKEKGGVYEADGALWLAAESHGGAKDSVLIRSDGRPTYLMVDIAYHMDKHVRGFDRVLDVQGADHQVEQTCVKAALRILGYPEGFLDYAVHQFVSLKEGGAVRRMSTRAGRFVTLRDLIQDLGKDIVRFFMVSRKPEAHLDFDLDLARSESIDNPATYIQYAHTRIASIFRKADAEEIPWASVDLSPLVEAEERELIKSLDAFPEVIQNAAQSFAPHLLAEYAMQLSRAFHAYYDRHRVLTDDQKVSHARLALLRALRIALRESLEILGMDAPEAM